MTLQTQRPQSAQRLSFFSVCCLGSILILAFALRVHLLGAQSFWNDEGNSYVQATRTFADIAFHAGRDIHPPGYYWLLGGWQRLAGESEFALRFPSAAASLLTVALTFAIGRRLYGSAAGLAAALLVALNTFSVYYAQEARMYALLALWSAAGMWALVRLLDGGRRWMIALGLLNAAGLYTQYAYPLVMLAQGALVVALAFNGLLRSETRRAALRLVAAFTAANVLALALFAPWLPTALAQVTTWPNTGTPTEPVAMLDAILHLFAFGVVQSGTPLAIPLILAAFGLMWHRQCGTPTRGLMSAEASQHVRAGLLLPVLWVALPVAVFLVLGLYRPANLKFLLPSQVGFALWLARGAWVVWQIVPRRLGRMTGLARQTPTGRWIAPLAAVLALTWVALAAWDDLPALYGDPAYQRADYRAIAAEVERRLRDGDAIILNAPNQEEVFRYYYRGAAPVYPLPPGLGGDDAETRAAVERIIAQHARAFVVLWGEAERDPNRIVEATLDAGAFEIADTWYGDVRLARYVMPVEPSIEQASGARFGRHITLERYALSAQTARTGDVLQIRLEWTTNIPLDRRYKVFVQLLDPDGRLAAQRDSEPGGGLALTTTWTPGQPVIDNHALLIPDDLPPGDYPLIVGLYDLDDASARLPTADGDFLTLTQVRLAP